MLSALLVWGCTALSVTCGSAVFLAIFGETQSGWLEKLFSVRVVDATYACEPFYDENAIKNPSAAASSGLLLLMIFFAGVRYWDALCKDKYLMINVVTSAWTTWCGMGVHLLGDAPIMISTIPISGTLTLLALAFGVHVDLERKGIRANPPHMQLALLVILCVQMPLAPAFVYNGSLRGLVPYQGSLFLAAIAWLVAFLSRKVADPPLAMAYILMFASIGAFVFATMFVDGLMCEQLRALSLTIPWHTVSHILLYPYGAGMILHARTVSRRFTAVGPATCTPSAQVKKAI